MAPNTMCRLSPAAGVGAGAASDVNSVSVERTWSLRLSSRLRSRVRICATASTSGA